MSDAVSRERIEEGEKVIRPYVRRTPVIAVDAADFGANAADAQAKGDGSTRRIGDNGGGAKLTLKLELLQHSGSFKARGAFANLLLREVPGAGVVAASGGNHGVAVSYAAMKLGIRAKIFVPSVASQEKVDRIRANGAELVIGGERYADAQAASEIWRAESGAMMVHPYDQEETMLGQGSVGMEFEEQAPEIDTLLVAVGGGGLIAGIASWYAGKVRIIGVEPEAAPTLFNAMRAGKPVDSEAGGVAADSLAPKRVGELMFPIAQKFVERVVLVTDDAIRAAQRALWKTMRVASEPGGAAAMSAILSGRYVPERGERVGVLVCGGNTTAVDFGR
jgi:threonine dehydratase